MKKFSQDFDLFQDNFDLQTFDLWGNEGASITIDYTSYS